MAKDDRDIVSAIRFHKTEKSARRVFKSGDEDELAKVATPAELRTWHEAGVITGTWDKASPKDK